METRGRKPGYEHTDKTKSKISQTLSGRPHSETRKKKISAGREFYDLDEKCQRRFEELRKEYPKQRLFFDDNEQDLIFAMENIISESELYYIRMRVETGNIAPNMPYMYETSSIHSAEDAVIALLDFKRYVRKLH